LLCERIRGEQWRGKGVGKQIRQKRHEVSQGGQGRVVVLAKDTDNLVSPVNPQCWVAARCRNGRFRGTDWTES
jgi:hypothetical protein